MIKPECLITGCKLITCLGHAWGDLHRLGTVFIFNAVLDAAGETKWERAELRGEVVKTLKVPNDQDFFERRGLIIFPANTAIMNAAAASYIRKWAP